MRCHIKVKDKNLNTAQLKLLHSWSLISTYMYMNDDGRSPIIVTKSHLTPHNGRPVYVTSEKKPSENYPYRTLSSNCVFWHWHIVYLTVLLTDLRKNYITMHIIRSLAGMSFKKKGTIIWTLQWFYFRSFKGDWISDPFDINTWLTNLI